jgi:hypothetical protein
MDELNQTYFMYGHKERQSPKGFVRHASDFHVPTQFRDRISLKEGPLDMNA